jgi:phospholipase/carboxylesterase
MPEIHRRYGELSCMQIDDLPPGQSPELLAIFCHGFGAPGDDLVSLAEALCSVEPWLADKVRWIFPEAPLEPSEMKQYGGRAWWPINIARLMELVSAGDHSEVRNARPEGMDDASAKLQAAILAAASEAKLPLSKVVLGGFSQGAMVTTDAALALDESPAAMVLWSGMLLSEDVWKVRAPRRAGGEALRDLLVQGGCAVEFIPFQGGHAIPPASIQSAAKIMKSRLGKPE